MAKAHGKKEKIRISKVIKWFHKYIPEVEIISVGLGADTNDYLHDVHSANKGAPDLSLRIPNTDTEIISLEVSGTEKMKGQGYWIRKDKVDYIKDNRHKDVWIVLHYQVPKEQYVWVKIDSNKSYKTVNINIKGVIEYFIVLHKNSNDIISSSDFKNYILDKVKQLT